jgi:hypothetical protein
LISEKQYPKVFSWIGRFNDELKKAKAKAPKPTTLKGDAAAQRIFNAPYVDDNLRIDGSDPLGFPNGTAVEVFPIDSGTRHRDQGELVGLTEDEIVLSLPQQAKPLRAHYPRTGFRIRAITTKESAKL